jgi:transcriptional regulator with XRE-family HTH domain
VEIREGLGGLSQTELIERLGLVWLNRGEISDFERDVREPDLITLKAYADAAGVSVDDLIDDSVKLPKRLPGAKRLANAGAKPDMNMTTVVLSLEIVSSGHIAREEVRARGLIERAQLKKHKMKKLGDGEYELTLSYQDEDDLDEQIYALLGAIKREARASKCTVKLDVHQKKTDRHW